MEALCVGASLIGTEKNLLVDDGYRWVDNIPNFTWNLTGCIKIDDTMCLDTLFRLHHVVIDYSPPEKFVKMMSSVAPNMSANVPWAKVMHPRDHRVFVKNVVNQATGVIDKYSKDYYLNTWVPESLILQSLQPAKISQRRYEECVRDAGMNAKSLAGFCPGHDGYARSVRYDRFGTRTGRLTVSSGPGILTLKKEYRNMVMPSTTDGKIIYVDFAALEARVVLYEAGTRCDDTDLYGNIANEVFGGKVSRNSAKIAVISELYGSGKAALGESLGISGNELDEFVSKIRRYFKTDDLKLRVKEQFLREGYITNRYGRRINIDEPIDRIFVNSYVQSTGVDVALLGFSELMKCFSKRPGIRPLFVLHDALVLDVSKDCIEEVMGITHVKVPGYVQKFPLKCEIFLHLNKHGFMDNFLSCRSPQKISRKTITSIVRCVKSWETGQRLLLDLLMILETGWPCAPRRQRRNIIMHFLVDLLNTLFEY